MARQLSDGPLAPFGLKGHEVADVLTCRVAQGAASGPRKLRTTTESNTALPGAILCHNCRITWRLGGWLLGPVIHVSSSHSGVSGSAHHVGRRRQTRFLTGRSLPIDPRLGINGASGRIVVAFNTETADLTVINRRGHVQDVCATLGRPMLMT